MIMMQKNAFRISACLLALGEPQGNLLASVNGSWMEMFWFQPVDEGWNQNELAVH
jgi:hypothetical protein